MKILTTTLLATVSIQTLTACDCCSVFSACNLQTENQKGFVAGIAEQYSHFGTLQMDGMKTSGNGEYLDSLIMQIFAAYNFNERLSVQLNLPVIYRAYGSHTMSADTSGLGDISFTGNYRIFQHIGTDWSFNWSVLGGVKLPTGDSRDLTIADEALPDGIGGHDIALGSGSVDGIVGSGFFVMCKRVFLTGSAQYAIRSTGDFGHRYANDWTWSGGPGAYLWLGERGTLSLQVVVSGDSKYKDTFYGVADGDSAATAVYLGPQLNATWGARWSAQLGADLPVSIANSGLQVVPDYRIHAALTFRF